MNTLVSTLPARTLGRDHAAPTFLDTLRGFFTHSTSQMMAQARAAVAYARPIRARHRLVHAPYR